MGAGLRKLVFQPPAPTYGDDPNLVWLTTSKREVIPAFHVFRSASKLTLIFSHGNAEDLGMIVNYFKELSKIWDVNIFAYEYSGYGMSSGTPSEENVYADAEAAYNYLTQKFKIPWWKIVLYGRSLGTGASVHLASKRPVRGMILQSSLLSVHRVGLNLRMTLPGDMFCNIDKIHKVSCPVFIIHGVKDEIIPFSHGMQLYNACPTAVTPYWIEGAGHNNVELTGEVEFVENITRFLKFLESAPSDNPQEVLELYKDHDKFLHYAIGTSAALQCPESSDVRSLKAKSTSSRKDSRRNVPPKSALPRSGHGRSSPRRASPMDPRRQRVRSSTPRIKEQAVAATRKGKNGFRERSLVSVLDSRADTPRPSCSRSSPRQSRLPNLKQVQRKHDQCHRSDERGLSPRRPENSRQPDRIKSFDSWHLAPVGKDYGLLGHIKRHSEFWKRDRHIAAPSIGIEAQMSPRKSKDTSVRHAISKYLKRPDTPYAKFASIPEAPGSQASPRKEVAHGKAQPQHAPPPQASAVRIPLPPVEAAPSRRMKVRVPQLSRNPPYTVPQPPNHNEAARRRQHTKLGGCIPRNDSGDAVSTSAESTRLSSSRGRHYSPRSRRERATRTVRCI